MLPSLPLDVIIQVMHKADYQTIISLRKTSRSLNLLTRTHEVWARLLAESDDADPDQKPRIFYLERALSTFSASELENFYIERVKDKTAWVTKGLTNRKDSLDTSWPSGRSDCMILVPGGRWLLVPEDPKSSMTVSSALTREMRAERIWYFDLNNSDTPHSTRRALFGDQSYDLSTMSLSGPQIDTSSPTLTFNFAQVYREQTGENVHGDKAPWLLHIWRVILQHNSTFKYENLSAQCLKTIDLGEMEETRTMHLFEGSLLDDRVALDIAINEEISSVMVMNWTEVVDGGNRYQGTPLPRVMTKNQLGALQLLPDSKILFVAKSGSVTSVQYDSERLASISLPSADNAFDNLDDETGLTFNEHFLGTLPGVDPNAWERKKSYSPFKFLRYYGKDVVRLSYITTDNYQLYTAQIDYTSIVKLTTENETTEAAVTMGLEHLDLSQRVSVRDAGTIRHLVDQAAYDSIALSHEYGVVIRGQLMHVIWNMTTIHGPRAKRLMVGNVPLAEVLVVDRASGRIIIRDDGNLFVIHAEDASNETPKEGLYLHSI